MATLGVFAFKRVFDIAASLADNQRKILCNVNGEIKNLGEFVLPTIKHYINLVEDVKLHKKLEVQTEQMRPQEEAWVQRLKDVAFDAEDILDEVSIWSERFPLPTAFASERLNFCVELVCGCFAPSCMGYSNSNRSDARSEWPIKFYIQIANRINDIYKKLNKIADIQKMVNGILPDSVRSSQPPLASFSAIGVNDTEHYERKHRETTSYMDKHFIKVGRDGEKDEILSKLFGPESKLLVIPIVGMGGMGKTTLASSIFSDARVKAHFEITKWVFVGMSFEVEMLIKKGIFDDRQCSDSLEKLYERVIELVKGKKFLIVLDDVWNEDQDQWQRLLRPLSHGGDGSRILITTRSAEVARIECNSLVYTVKLGTLDHAHSLELFEQHAFPNGVRDEYNSLRSIGEKIVRKLDGLPLAAKVIGSTLRGEVSESEWKKILDSNLLSVGTKNARNIKPALLLSYFRLPPHLRPCFRICSIFPKGESFSKTMVIELWIAHGYVAGGTGLVDLGSRYVDELCSASLLEVADGKQCSFGWICGGCLDDDGDARFEMHDLIHDLVELVSGDEVCKIVERDWHFEIVSAGEIIKIEQGSEIWPEPRKNVRHLAIYGNCIGSIWENLFTFIDWRRLRTLIVRDWNGLPEHNWSQLHLIRVVVASHMQSGKDFTKSLIHLRILSLAKHDGPVPKQHVYTLTSYRLRILHHGSYSSVKGIGRLTSLQQLDNYTVYDKNGYRMKELKGLQLQGKLTIRKLENVKGGTREAKEAMLHEKKSLKYLMFEWSPAAALPRSHEEVLEGLEPPSNLENLGIEGFKGLRCGPSWMTKHALASVVSIYLWSCHNLLELPPLGQLSKVKVLHVYELPKLQKVTAQFYGIGDTVVFPSLEDLVFDDMPECVEWEGRDDNGSSLEWFPKLQRLRIFSCPKLREIPHLACAVRKLKLYAVGLAELPKYWGCNGAVQQQAFLHSLELCKCPFLKSLGECLLHHPTPTNKLERLEVIECNALVEVSTAKHIFGIEYIEIRDCKILKALQLAGVRRVERLDMIGCPNLNDISFQSLSSLESLRLSDCGSSLASTIKAVPPIKLTKLHIELKTPSNAGNTPHLTHDKQWWQSLASLEELWLTNADGLLLQSWFWSALRHLPSLQEFYLKDCTEISSLQDEYLPPSLRRLKIYRCPKLEVLYKRGGPGRDILLARIPELQISKWGS